MVLFIRTPPLMVGRKKEAAAKILASGLRGSVMLPYYH